MRFSRNTFRSKTAPIDCPYPPAEAGGLFVVVIIKPNPEIIAKLEEKFGGIQDHFERVFGYGFDQLTQSEARYLANFEPAELVRERILAQEPQRKWTPVPAAGNQEGSGRKEKKGLMPDFADAPAQRTPRNELGHTP